MEPRAASVDRVELDSDKIDQACHLVNGKIVTTLRGGRAMAQDAAGSRGRYHHGDLRGALLAAARLILEEQGPRALTLREVARRAGVSHAAPRHHYASLRDFMADCAAMGFEDLATALSSAWQGHPDDPRAGLCAMGRAYVMFALGHRAIFRLMFDRDTYAEPTADLMASGERAYSVLVGGVDALAPARPAADKALAVSTLWSLVHGLATLMLEGKIIGPDPPREVAGAHVEAACRLAIEGYLARQPGEAATLGGPLHNGPPGCC
jgi:AcrR family transcriptional regulator